MRHEHHLTLHVLALRHYDFYLLGSRHLRVGLEDHVGLLGMARRRTRSVPPAFGEVEVDPG